MPFTGLSEEVYTAVVSSPQGGLIYDEIVQRQLEIHKLRSELQRSQSDLEAARFVSQTHAWEICNLEAQLRYFKQPRGGGAAAPDVEVPR